MKRTKVLTTFILTIVTSVMLEGCSVSSWFEQGSMKRYMENETITLTFMLPQTHFKSFVQEAILKFEEEHEGVKIDVQVIPDNQWTNLVTTKAFTNETPDIIRIDKGVIMEIGKDRFVEFDESEPWMERVIDSELEYKKIDGRVYGLPVCSNSTLGLVYNKKLFEENNLAIPKTIEEMKAVCESFKKIGIITLYASDKDSWTTQIWFSGAADQIAPKGTWDKLLKNELSWSDIPEFIQVLNDMVLLRELGYTNDNYMMATYSSAVDAMAAGSVAMCASGHFFLNDVLNKNPNIDLGMAPLPYDDKITVIQGGGQLAIFKKSKHVSVAKEFLDWFSQAENMDIFTEGWGYTPLFKDQKEKLPMWLEELNEQYINSGNVAFHIESELMGVNTNDFWSSQQEMLGGDLTALEALKKWDESFQRQMRDKKFPGWIS